MRCKLTLAVLAAALLSITVCSALAGDEIVAKTGEPLIIKVFDVPMGIEANQEKDPFMGYTGKYTVQYGVLPMNAVTLQEDQILRIRVAGDDDILIRCAGNLYAVSREKTPAQAKLLMPPRKQ